MAIKYKNISFQAAELLDQLLEKDKVCFSIETAFALLPGSSRDAVKRLLSDMTRRGLLMRVKAGLYHVIPFEEDPASYMPDWHLLGCCIASDTGHYIAYFSAMQLHGLTTQPHLREQVVVDRQIKPTTLMVRDIPFQFIYHNEGHFFGYKQVWIDSYRKVPCSDLEKTIIDGLFKPEYAGGITEIGKALYVARNRIDHDRLLTYALRFDSQAVIKRLGYLLELLEISTPITHDLQRSRTNSVVLLEPSWPNAGKTISRWSIRQNLERESILSPIFS